MAKQIWFNKIATFNTYLCSWHHLLQIHCCKYTQSYQFCQCSWHTYDSCVSQIHTHWCLLKESNGKRCDTENNSKTYYIVCLQQRYVWTSSAEYNIIKCLFNYDSITGLTCTVDSISTKTSIADTLKATNGVITGGIFMAVINFSCTVINICNEQVVQLCYQHPSKNKHPLQIVHIGKQQFCGVCEQFDFSTQPPALIYSGCWRPSYHLKIFLYH